MGRDDDHARTDPRARVGDAREPYNHETPVPLLDERLTPAADLFVRNNGLWPDTIPADPGSWVLRIDGELERPATFTVDELRRRFTPTSLVAVLECAGNGRALLDPPVEGTQWGHGAVGCARFTGVRLADLLEQVRPTSRAVYTAHHSPDRTADGTVAISRGLPLWKALAPETIVAFGMNDEQLPVAHGGPLRIVAPGFPGSAWQKWLERIELRDREHDGEKMTGTDYRLPARPLAPGEPFEDELFDIIEDVPINSLITQPSEDGTVRVGEELEVAGWAWSGSTPVASVAISVDGGVAWQVATLEPAMDRWAWRRFRLRTGPSAAGVMTVVARATDALGRMQPLRQAWNPRGYNNNGCHRIDLAVV